MGIKLLNPYAKVLTLGSSRTENALIGEVIVQEKIDGSQFSVGLNEEGELRMRSHRAYVDPDNPGTLFAEGVEHLLSREKIMKNNLAPNTQLFMEYLKQPKHNVLRYARMPLNHFMLFDATVNGRWVDREELLLLAVALDIELVPELYRGHVNLNLIEKLLTTPSILGDVVVEGVVMKNYGQNLELGGYIFPLITKIVRPEFKETLQKNILSERNTLQDYINSFQSEARWGKAIQHLEEDGELLHEPKDIGRLIGEIQKDILEEEEDNIKEFLFKHYLKDIMRAVVRGFPEYYKSKLLENVREE